MEPDTVRRWGELFGVNPWAILALALLTMLWRELRRYMAEWQRAHRRSLKTARDLADATREQTRQLRELMFTVTGNAQALRRRATDERGTGE